MPDREHKVSIITVVYNGAKTLEQTIQSVLNQTYTNIEYVIIDGQSTDGTLEIIEKYKDKISYYVSEPDKGIYDAMNKGLAAASGDIIGILNADDWYDSNAVKYVMDCFADNDADIVYGGFNRVESDGTILATKPAPLTELWYEILICHQAAFVKREVYQKMGGYSLDYKIASDYDFFLRCYSKQIKFEYLDKELVYFRFTGISSTKHLKCAEEINQIALQYIEQVPDRQRLLDENRYRIKMAVFRENCDIGSKMVIESIPWLKNNKIIVWGTGVWGRRIIKLFKDFGIEIDYLVDSNPGKEGTQLLDIEIKNPRTLKESRSYIIVAIRRVDQNIQKQLVQLGVERERYLFLEEWMTYLAEKTEIYQRKYNRGDNEAE